MLRCARTLLGSGRPPIVACCLGLVASTAWFGVLGCLGSLIPCAFAAPGATRQGCSADIRVERENGALGCPDDDGLTARVERILQRPLSGDATPERSIRVRVRFRHIGDAFVADLEFHGSKEGVRVLNDRSPQCDTLADAVSVAIALVVDRELEQEQSSAAGTLVGLPSPTATQSAEPSRGQREPHDTVRGPLLRLSAGGGVATGFGDAVSPQLGVRLTVPVSHWALNASVDFVMPSRTEFSGGKVETSLLLGSLGVCRIFGERVWWGPCALVGIGRLRGRGLGYDEDRTEDMLWTAAGAGVVVEGRVGGPLFWGMTADLWVAPRQQSYLVQNVGSAWQSAPLSGWVAFRTGLRFR